MPFISILIPAYNCSTTIKKLLDSIPVRSDLEILVANDCSTDSTLEVLMSYKGLNEIKILDFKTNHGVGFIRNRLVEYSSGTWICWADSDDYFLTSKLNSVFDNLYSLKNYNKVNVMAELNNGYVRGRGCEPWGSIIKRNVYELLKYPEIRSAEDFYFKKCLNQWYSSFIKEYNSGKIVYHYNSHAGSLYSQKKQAKLDGDTEKFNFLEDPDILDEYLNPLDIVVTYLNSSDPDWLEQYNYWREYEISNKIQDKNNIQAFGPERTRNWGEAFRYWFRGIEKNFPSVRYVHLICFSENHIPAWLNTDNPKLKIHFHREFIPAEYLPTFSIITIESFIHRIPNLSNNYILTDDDFYFLNYTPQTLFVKNGQIFGGTSIYKNKRYSSGWGTWGKILNSTLDYVDPNITYNLPHLPMVESKENEKKLLKEKMISANTESKFRKSTNILMSMASYNNLIDSGKMIPSEELYKNSKFENISVHTNFSEFKKYQMVCFNDSEKIKNTDEYNIINYRLNDFLNTVLPDKSSFEKNDLEKLN